MRLGSSLLLPTWPVFPINTSITIIFDRDMVAFSYINELLQNLFYNTADKPIPVDESHVDSSEGHHRITIEVMQWLEFGKNGVIASPGSLRFPFAPHSPFESPSFFNDKIRPDICLITCIRTKIARRARRWRRSPQLPFQPHLPLSLVDQDFCLAKSIVRAINV